MMSATAGIAVLCAVTFLAIAVASAAMLRARAARAALLARDRQHRESVELARPMEATGRLAGDVAHDVTDLLTAIAGRAELLIASLDPAGTGIQDALEIRRTALRAAQLTRPLRTPGDELHVSTDVIDVSAVPPRTATSLQQMLGTKIDVTLSLDNDIRRSRIVASQLEAAPLRDLPPAEARVRAAVLVVEDEPQIRELIRLVLVRAGHAVVAVAGPHAALAALNRQAAISLMLVDIVMPEMDGYDLVAEARKLSPGIHVVFMSAFAHDTSRHPNGDGFLAKPFTIESLTGMVEEALAG